VAAGVDIGCSGWELDRIVAAAREQERPARVHLKVDTGLGRNGVTLEGWDHLVGEALEYQDQGLLRVVGIFSHLAVADEPERPETDDQLAAFREVLAVAEDAGVDPEVRHLANTPATLSRPDTHFDLVRVGLGIYGLSPFEGQSSGELGLRPAMTLRTLVSQSKHVPEGQGVSYGLRYHTTGPSTLALIPVGYADGIPRVATGGPVRVAGHTYPVVGRIAMDQMVIDLGDASQASAGLLGAEAELFGTGSNGGPTADDWARAAGTNNYEIVTRISPRVPRQFINEASALPGSGKQPTP
jgi:alanine racemase